MLDMLCALPSPCGNEEILKKYIKTKLECESYEDTIGNLIIRKNGGQQKVMIYCPIDEDAIVALSVKDENVYFAHIGKKSLNVGDTVSFGGYKGVVCAKNKEKPTEDQYISMLIKDKIEPGMVGTIDGDYYEEEGVAYGKAIAHRAGIQVLVEASKYETNFDLYLVFGVQSNHNNKGAIVASRAINPERVIIIEQTDAKSDTLTFKVSTKGFICHKDMCSNIKEVCENNDIKIQSTVDTKEDSSSQAFNSPLVGVIGVPVNFPQFTRQSMNLSLCEELNKFIKAYINQKN